MTCETRMCPRPGCANPRPKKKTGPGYAKYCSQACNQAVNRAKQRALQQSSSTAPKVGQDEGPDVPLNGWTEELAQARMERLVVEALREGVLVEALAERFAVTSRVVRAVAARHQVAVPCQSARNPPFGTPAR
ncbi:hypothetical protein [Myxococcus sp. AS-1-15]|uniref:hypothetical protein n=1 Tax=Myxococcus sp. AS-1-15 TaxID=2874600 RepID=UPI001CC0B943|nr:hypothetical protein [Myxococcus sp. AS-1-15]MBZ4400405.1 hypothetical protein [Myxococcus sp. AS-1-15]